ncbi:MAG: DoxX family protein, partial [Planctomycetaceae bacterium]
MSAQPKWMTVAGWGLTLLAGAGLLFSASMKLQKHPEAVKGMVEMFGYAESVVVTIGIVEGVCALLYLIPQTSVLGAVLLTGYLGGATATHVRVEDQFAGPIIGGVLVWLGLFLRDP